MFDFEYVATIGVFVILAMPCIFLLIEITRIIVIALKTDHKTKQNTTSGEYYGEGNSDVLFIDGSSHHSTGDSGHSGDCGSGDGGCH